MNDPPNPGPLDPASVLHGTSLMRASRPRLHPAVYRGLGRFLLTLCTDGRRLVFLTGDAVELIWTQILRAARRHRFAVLAYCFMPDHVHLLVQGLADSASLNRFAHAAKQRGGFAWSRATGGARLWQPSYHDHALRSEETTDAVIRYFLENPIRAGLVERVDEYPFVGSEVYSREQLLGMVWEQEGCQRP